MGLLSNYFNLGTRYVAVHNILKQSLPRPNYIVCFIKDRTNPPWCIFQVALQRFWIFFYVLKILYMYALLLEEDCVTNQVLNKPIMSPA